MVNFCFFLNATITYYINMILSIPGAVVGLAIAMAVLFFVLGFGAVYMFYRRNGGTFKSDKPMDNPAYENAE